MPQPKMKILFLQGHPTGFWHRLATALEDAGIGTRKVHFCLADWAFWRKSGAVSYKGRFRNWPEWLRGYIQREGITDIFYYADRLPYHAKAQKVAKGMGVNCWAIEFGYLRPDWLTMEEDGMGPMSKFPRSRKAIEALAKGIAPPDMAIHYPYLFRDEAFGEVVFNLLMAYGRPLYPFFVSDKYYWPAIDYLAWLVELTKSRKYTREARRVFDLCVKGAIEYNLAAMQLQSDYQIRASTHYVHLEEFLNEVMSSFAANSPPQRHLVIKLHPLDNGLERWPRRIDRLTAKYALDGRVHTIKGGALDPLITHSKGVVLANSTVGLHAIRLGSSVIALGRAIFDIPGLSHQSGLDTFWKSPERVDPIFAADFQRALSTIQIKGSFYNREGQKAAIRQIVERMSA